MESAYDWIAVEQARLVGLHPAFDPRVWDLREAEERLDQAAEAEIRRIDDLTALSEEIERLRQRVDVQGQIITRLLALFAEDARALRPHTE